MKRQNLWLALLLGMATGGAFAQEPAMCKSLCASEQQTCRKDAVKLTELDKDVFMSQDEKNPMAHAAAQGQMASGPTRAAENDEFHRRRAERTGVCDTTFKRCVRACGGADASTGSSEILTKQGKAKRDAAQGQPRP